MKRLLVTTAILAHSFCVRLVKAVSLVMVKILKNDVIFMKLCIFIRKKKYFFDV